MLERAVTVPGQPGADHTNTDIDEVVYRCQLNEVYLLFDFISGRSDLSLAGLDGMVDPAQPSRTLNTAEVLAAVGRIRYPPPTGVTDRACDAALLLAVKDRLNRMASPATGLTVAYTTMFAGGAPMGRAHRLWPWRGREGGATRVTLAEQAYPGLVPSARRFRWTVAALIAASLLATVLTVYVSFDVALGRSLLQRFDALNVQQTALSTRIYGAEHALEQAEAARDPRPTGTASPRLCPPDPHRPQSIEQQQICDEYADWGVKNGLAYRDLANYTRRGAFHMLYAAAMAEETNGQSEQLAAALLAAASATVLPVLFGLLGTAAAVVRGIYFHVSRRTLSPRELSLVLIRLPLGLLAGGSVGLFLSPNAAPVEGGVGLAGGLLLSASGIAFLAGYGVEALFSLFDAVLSRIFTLAPDGRRPDAAAAPTR